MYLMVTVMTRSHIAWTSRPVWFGWGGATKARIVLIHDQLRFENLESVEVAIQMLLLFMQSQWPQHQLSPIGFCSKVLIVALWTLGYVFALDIVAPMSQRNGANGS